MKPLTVAERLIVAADFKPDPGQGQGRDWVRGQILTLVAALMRTGGVYIKVNSALRACGDDLIDKIHQFGATKVCADLKLYDIGETLAMDGVFLREFQPELLTAVCTAGVGPLKALKAELPDTEVLGVTVLTSLSDDDTRAMFVCSTKEAVCRLAGVAVSAGLDGLVSAPKEVEMLRADFSTMVTLNTPAVRPKWTTVLGDDQNLKRVMTPEEAIIAGADRIVVGRPITRAKEPYEAVMRTLEEISAAL